MSFNRLINICLITPLIASFSFSAQANDTPGRGVAGSQTDAVAKFRQMGSEFRSPNMYRSASGAPGPAYWQQRANVDIDARLDEAERRIIAEMDIEYVNNSPDTLNYIWLALDQNRFKDGSLARMSATAASSGTPRGDSTSSSDRFSFSQLRYEHAMTDREYGFEFSQIADSRGNRLPYFINDSMMRIDLPTPSNPEQPSNFRSIGSIISSTKSLSEDVADMSTSLKTTIIFLVWRNGFLAWPPIRTIPVGRTSNF